MPNRLIHESSPYLKQHADNPVDWYPWGDEALRRAREENKPILLSIGYSACHWCHVMAHESFEDGATAHLMNDRFINIKVDREERPDLDQIYQHAHALMAQRPGGWPLTMFLTPDQVPFFGGTYFPPTPRHGLPSFGDLLQRVHEFYQTHPDEIRQQNASLLSALRHGNRQGGTAALNPEMLALAYQQMERLFDRVHGGFGEAPKFPHTADLAFLLRYGHISEQTTAGHMARFSLRKMVDGGLYDQLGGGFYRYSVDAHWEIPHFEKMLYDNGSLLSLCSDAYLAGGEPRLAEVVEETVAWLLGEMRAPEGGFYAALDADSAGQEGAFYVWTQDQVAALLSPEEYAVIGLYFGLNEKPNFEQHAWHFHLSQTPEAIAQGLQLDRDTVMQRIGAARAKLLAARGARPRPGRDDKILCAWNGLVVGGLARAGVALRQPAWIVAAQETVDFLRERLWDGTVLRAVYAEDGAKFNGYLDDYAFLLNGLIDLMQAGFRSVDLDFAQALADVLLREFQDQDGGFFFTGHSHEELIHRPKVAYDSAMPSGNGVAAFALQRLGHLLAAPRYLEAAEHCLRHFSESLAQTPGGAMSLVIALSEYVHPPRIILLRGDAAVLEGWRQRLQGRFRPFDLVLALPNDLTGLPEALNKAPGRPAGAWICHNMSCSPEITDLDTLLAT